MAVKRLIPLLLMLLVLAGTSLRSAEAPIRVGARSDAGEGGFGAVASAYAVSCGGTTRRIVFDMYHAEHVENRAPEGFSIRP